MRRLGDEFRIGGLQRVERGLRACTVTAQKLRPRNADEQGRIGCELADERAAVELDGIAILPALHELLGEGTLGVDRTHHLDLPHRRAVVLVGIEGTRAPRFSLCAPRVRVSPGTISMKK